MEHKTFEIYKRRFKIEKVEYRDGKYCLSFVCLNSQGNIHKRYWLKRKELMRFVIKTGFLNYHAIAADYYFDFKDLIGFQIYIYLNENLEIIDFEEVGG